MKKTGLQFVFFLTLSISAFAQDANIRINNISAGYVFNTSLNKVTGAYFEVCADGDNSASVVPDFEVSLYLIECDPSTGAATGSTPYFVKTYVASGLNHYGCLSYSNKSFTIASLSSLATVPPPGTYRLGFFANSNEAIPNPPDVKNDNAALLRDDNWGTAANSIITVPDFNATGIGSIANTLNALSVFPNPISNTSTLRFTTTKEEEVRVSVYNVTGQLVKTLVNGNLAAGNHVYVLNGEDFAQGVYYATITTKEGIVTEKFAKQ